MNKFKSIFCAVMLFMVCAIMCVGCSFGEDNLPSDSDSDSDSKEITISLTEAESVIYDVLQIQAGQINRDAFKKWCKFELTSVLRAVNPNTNNLIASQKTSLFATYENGVYDNVYSTYELRDVEHDQHTIRESYTVDNIQYSYENSTVSNDNVDKVELPSEADVVKKLFTDDFLYLVYGNKVTKKVTTDGYTLVFRNGLQGLANFLYIMSGRDVDDIEEYAGSYIEQLKTMYSDTELSEVYIQLSVEFDKQNNITEIKFSYLALEPSQYGKSDAVITAKKSTENFQAPQWYLYHFVDAK